MPLLQLLIYSNNHYVLNENKSDFRDDPDIWPPPTPSNKYDSDSRSIEDFSNQKRPNTNERNLPSWARMRAVDENRRVHLNKAAVPIQRSRPSG